MRKTLALLGAAALAVAGLAGPANASDVSQQNDVILADVVADTSSPTIDAWAELETTSGMVESLEDVSIVACIGSRQDPTLLITFGPADEVPAAGEHISSDPGATLVSPDSTWRSAASGEFDSNDFDTRLALNYPGPNASAFAQKTQNPGETLHSGCVDQMPSLS